MRQQRTVRRAMAAVLAMAFGPAIVARADDPWVGRRVITRYGAVLKVGRQVVDDEGRGRASSRGIDQRIFRVYRVEQVNGRWLWLVEEGGGTRAGWRRNG